MTDADTNLPAGWTTVALRDIAGEPNQRVPAADEPFSYIDIGSIDRTAKVIRKPQRMLGKDAPSRARKMVAAGDTLVSMTRPNLNAVALVPDALDGQIASTGFDVLRPASGIDPRWLAYLVRTDEFVRAMSELVQGALYPAIRSKDVRGFVAPLAPTSEQTRIADELDTLLARIQACQDHLEAVPALLKRLRQAVLGAATSGALTEEWRGHPETTEWERTVVSEVLEGKPRNGYSPKSVEFETAVRSLTLSATTSGRFLPRHTKFIDERIPSDSHLWLEPGDILIQRANTLEYVGVSAIFDGPRKAFIYPDLMMRCRPNSRVHGRFLFYLLSAEPTRRYFRDQATGTAGNMPKINQQTVMSAPIDLPPMGEQVEIVQRAEKLLGVANLVERRHRAASIYAQRLAAVTLAKAFRGELVPQDPNDEPASALLARIAVQRTAPSKTSSARAPRRGSPPRAPKETATMTKSRQDQDVMGQPYLAQHLRHIGTPTSAETLFKAAELSVADFYKQLAWEVGQGHVKDNQTTLEPGHAAG